jgi:hypothetical protein
MIDLDELAAVAMAATQGPWLLSKPRPTEDFKEGLGGGGELVELDVGSHGGFGILVWRMEDDQISPRCQANARHVATASPQAVLELIKRLKETQNSDQHNFDRWQACQEKLEVDEKRIGSLIKELNERFTNQCSVEYKLEAAEKDAARLDYLQDKLPESVIRLGDSWYWRTGYGKPHKKAQSLREAIDAAMKEQPCT